MNILVTGSNGFIGKHLCYSIKKANHTLLKYDIENTLEELEVMIKKADWIIHLAGVMRPNNIDDFYKVNSDLTETLSALIVKNNSSCSIILASSVQSTLNNDYGISKLKAENTLYKLSKEHKNKVAVFRLSNAFGKWGKPNYNSVVATFCNNIVHGLPITINDPNALVNFIYIDDIVSTFLNVINNKQKFLEFQPNKVKPEHPVTVGNLAETLYRYKKCFDEGVEPILNNQFEKALFCEFTSFFSQYFSIVKQNDNAFLNVATKLFDNQEEQIYSVYLKKNDIIGNAFFNSSTLFVSCLSGDVEVRIRKAYERDIIDLRLEDHKKQLIIPCGFVFQIKNCSKTHSILIVKRKMANYLSDDYFEEKL